MSALGVPPRKGLGVALSASSPRSFLAAGYPLQSLTRNALVVVLVSALCSCQNHETSTQKATPIASVPHKTRNIEKLTYYSSGAIEWRYTVLNDTLEGPAVYFDSLGNKREEHWYSKGVRKSLTTFNSDGFVTGSEISWSKDDLPPFRPEYIQLSSSDTVLVQGGEYKFRVVVPGIPESDLAPSVTNAVVYRAQNAYVLKIKEGPETCIRLTLYFNDTTKIAYGERCFSVVPR